MDLNKFKFSTTRTIILSFIIIYVSFGSSAYGQMRQIYFNDTAQNEILKFSFYTPSEGYVAFANWVGLTQDSGRSYSRKFITLNNVDYGSNSVNLTFGFQIKGIKAFNQNKIIVYGDYGLIPAILYSTNGGNSFKLVFHSQYDPYLINGGILNMVFPENGVIGYAADGDRILKSIDQGLTWSIIKSEPFSFYDQLICIDKNTVFAFTSVYAGNKLIKTYNGGDTWEQVALPLLNTGRISTAYFMSGTIGWLSMCHKDNACYFYKTTDGGSSWTLLNNPKATSFNFYRLYFTDINTGYALYGQNTIYKTLNSGVNWEPLQRDNDYAFLGYSFNDMQVFNTNQIWAGGRHGFLEMSNNGGGIPLPKSYFNIDTIGSATSNIVNLNNYSKPGYTYKWFLNNEQISTTYNASYTHIINKLLDTIKLVVSNGIYTDTLEKNQEYFPVVNITEFTPTFAADYNTVTIMGNHFYGTTAVTFGGVNCINYSVISDHQINAVIIGGGSGDVKVFTQWGIGSLNGFTYFGPPDINLPTTISDSILCKAETVKIELKNTQKNVQYDLVDSVNIVYGSIISNGGTVTLQSKLITKTANYLIKASRTNIYAESIFTKNIFIQVEHTKSIFTSGNINIASGEKLYINNNSIEANNFNWRFKEDASIKTSTLIIPPAIIYSAAGQKTLELISTSFNGCSDTLAANVVFVYKKPFPDQVCYAQGIVDSVLKTSYESNPDFNKATLAKDNGYFISGYGNRSTLKSTKGNNIMYQNNNSSFFAKYTTDGVLSWQMALNNTGGISPYGRFTAQETDSLGNIYVLGYCSVRKYLTLQNGDSIKISSTLADTITYSHKINGFILKLDSTGKYLWHVVIDDPTNEIISSAQGGLPNVITLKGTQIILSGTFNNILNYYKNGLSQPLYNLPKSDNENFFIFKINMDGNLIWNMYFENGAVNRLTKLTGIGTDNNSNSYITGYCEQQVKIHDVGNINNITFTPNSYSQSSYLLKFDSTGKLIWKVFIKNSFNFKDIAANAIAIDSSGESYITGSASLYDSSQYFVITNSNGTTAKVSFSPYFLLKFDKNGMYRWGAGSRYGNYCEANSVTLKDGNIYTTGFIKDYGIVSQSSMVSSDGSKVSQQQYFNEFFIAKYDTSGILKRIIKSGHRADFSGNMVPNNMIIDKKNNFIISGMAQYRYLIKKYLCFTDSFTTTSTGGFYSKINADYCYADTPPIANAGAHKINCSGDSLIIGTDSISGNTYSWISKPAGFTSNVAQPLVAPNVTTTYYLSVLNDAGLITRDTVIITALNIPIATAGKSQSICLGNTVNIGSSAITRNKYSWASAPAGFSAAISNPIVTPIINTIYFLTVSNDVGCIKKDSVLITVNTLLAPSVTISVTDTSICTGSSTIFMAKTINGGDIPSYQWQINGVNIGEKHDTFLVNNLLNLSTVNVVMYSNATCAFPKNAMSNTITMKVSEVIPTIVITSTSNTICAGSNISFIANSKNGGLAPMYEWRNNGIKVGTDSSNYSTNTLLNGDVITATLTSNAVCARPAIVSSIGITIIVTPSSAPITISGNNKVTKGAIATIASLTNNVVSASQYQWQDSTFMHNWLNIKDSLLSAIRYKPSLTGDKLRCILTSKNVCTSQASDTSNVIKFIVESATSVDAEKIIYYPNPAINKITLDSLSLSSNWESVSVIGTNGIQKNVIKNILGQTKVSIEIGVLHTGLYIIVLTNKEGKTAYIKFLKK